MLGGIFQKRKKIQELRAPSLQDIKKFREIYGRHADRRHVETPACFERSIYKAISCQKELHAIDFRQEDVTDPQIVALAETLLEMPLVSSLDLRDNRITDDGAKALLEVLRLQIIVAKTPAKTDPKTKKVLPPPPVAEYTRYVTSVNLKGNEISAAVLDEMAQYTEILRREDKRLEIRAALHQIDCTVGGGVEEDDFKAVVKLLTGTEPSKKEVKQLMSQSNVGPDSLQNAAALENVLLAKCSSSPSKKAACPPWEALVQVQHAKIGGSPFLVTKRSPELHPDTGSNILSSSVQSSRPQTMSSTTLSSSSVPPPVPSSSGKPTLSIDTSDSPGKAKADFGPPSSPPPPLPLPQTTSPNQRSSFTPKLQTSGADGSVELGISETVRSPLERSNSSGSSALTRQNSSDTPRSAVPSTPVSPVPRDDYTMDFSSWRDEDPFSDDPDEAEQPRDYEIKDEMESVRSHEFSPSVASRSSVASSSRPTGIVSAPLTNNQKSNGGTSPTNNFGDISETDGKHGRRDLSSLAYNGGDITKAGTKDSRSLQNQLVAEIELLDTEEEEHYDSTVLDVMKDGKPRNVAKVIHSEFKRGYPLQDFPGDVPFRNLVALILSGNGLRDLGLFKECRFPCAVVLDLSNNALGRVGDEELACFPKLQVLDLSSNRLRVVGGLGKLFEVKALRLCHNQLRSVINLEHLVHLQILRLRGNAITAASALRLLSLNKMLSHLDLDENPLMETDERQRRKVTVHLLNIIPTLTTIGNMPIMGHHAKTKHKLTAVDAPMGRSLLEHDECPELRSLWASNACDILQIVQDREPERSRGGSYDDDDPYGEPSYSGTSSSPRARPKKLNRDEQRQKDELRSKFVGHRSRGKAPPSPVRAKTSPFEFGPPLPPTPKKAKKKLLDPKKAQEQKRRASQLSAPKHPPVDTEQLKQEQRRKSRPTFDVNMSVAERLQLARDKAPRRASSLLTETHRTSVVAHHPTTKHVPALVMEIRDPSSPVRVASPIRQQNSIVEFRVEPLPAASPLRAHETSQHVLSPRLPPGETLSGDIFTAERKPSSKESSFLQSLAVADFLSHAEEEISTAQTALNVLLSMCERSPSDPKKLSEYRNSLDALDILNERESQELFLLAMHHDDPVKTQACKSEFEKLCTLKKCIKELLQKLELHAAGSPTIRSYCTDLRATELRHIIEAKDEEHDVAEKDEVPVAAVSAFQPIQVPPGPESAPPVEKPALSTPEPMTLHSKLFSAMKDDEEALVSEKDEMDAKRSVEGLESAIDDDNEFDFLLSETTMFDVDVTPDSPMKVSAVSNDELAEVAKTEVSPVVESPAKPVEDLLSATPETAVEESEAEVSVPFERTERSISATSTDITQDIQQIGLEDEDEFDFDSELPLDEEAGAVVDEPSAPSDIQQIEPEVSEKEEEGEIEWGQQGTDLDVGEEPGSNLEHEMVEPQQSLEVSEPTETYEEDSTAAPLDQNEYEEEEEVGEEYGEQQEQEDQDDQQQQETVDVEVGDGDGDEDDEEAEMFGDWEKGFDPSTNHYFWFNHATGESQWVPPEGWPYEVDTPFEEDAEQEGEDEYEEDDQQVDGSALAESPAKSSYEADDDDVFSDQDLPDF